jgi:hypothetical protein
MGAALCTIQNIVATEALAAGLEQESWDELTQNVILAAWDFNEVYANGQDNDRRNNGDDNAFVGVEYGHHDLEEANLMMMTTTMADRDDSNDDA